MEFYHSNWLLSWLALIVIYGIFMFGCTCFSKFASTDKTLTWYREKWSRKYYRINGKVSYELINLALHEILRTREVIIPKLVVIMNYKQ